MPTFTSTATLDGFNSFFLAGFDRTLTWNQQDRFLGNMSVGDSNPSNIHDLSLTLRDNWEMATMRFPGWQSSVINLSIVDADTSTNRRINFLDLPDDTATLNLQTTRIGAMFGWGGAYTLNLGSGEHNYVRLGGRDDAGPSTLSLANGGRIESLHSDADLSVVLNGNSRIFSVKMDNGNHNFTSNTGWVESYSSWNANNTIRIGQGGMGQLLIDSPSNATNSGVQDIEARGWLGALNIMHNNSVRLVLGEEGGGMLRINTTVGSYVETGSGWVQGVQLGSANDTLVIGTGGVNFAHGGSGDDTFVFNLIHPDFGARVAGSFGRDTADFSRLSQNLRIDLNEGGWQEIAGRTDVGDLVMGLVQLQSIEVLIGGSGNDTLTGDRDDNELRGGLGNDVLMGMAGNDTIYGGAGDDAIGGGEGDDMIFGVSGANQIWGGLGNDTVEGGTGRDTIYGGGEGSNRLLGNDGDDLIFAGAGGDFIGGGAGNDTIRGGAGADTIYGGMGNDDLAGGAGDDVIFGSAGNNVIWGGLGRDTIHAGTGRDVMNGGPGADTFVFASAAHIGIGAGRDVISGFVSGEDRIDLSALNTQFNGTGGVLGGGQASFFYFAAGGLLIGDQTGNGVADWVLELAGAPGVGLGDFIL